MTAPSADTYTPEERDILARYFTNLDSNIFALINMPDVVKGALFSRYSRSPKSLRRLFLDEFYDPEMDAGSVTSGVGVEKAESFYERVLIEYGDDSVAQLVGAHIAVENASNVLTKVLEWGRLMSYLEQSTRYIPYNDKPGDRWRYHIPAELQGTSVEQSFVETMDACFETYSRWFEPAQAMLRERFPKDPADKNFVYRQSIRAKACDILRGLLPAATTANVGLFGSAQAFESLLLRLQAHPLAEARAAGDAILAELRKVIPVFMRRVDKPERGLAWSEYMRDATDRTGAAAAAIDLRPLVLDDAPSVRLTDFDPDGELKIVATALYPHARADDASLLDAVRAMPPTQRESILREYIGDRTNRRHRPGRAFERASYRFDVVSDYGAFRDLQRHRMLTMDWQPLSTSLGYDVPAEVRDLGAKHDWRAAMDAAATLYRSLEDAGFTAVAPYAVPMAYRIRYYMHMNAREAMHLIELRTSQQGHPAYRWIGQEMLRLIKEEAHHDAVAAAMIFANADDRAPTLERLAAERASDAKRNAASIG